MQELQRATENLLLLSGASRALLQIAGPDGALEIRAEAVQHGEGQFRQSGSGTNPLDRQVVARLRDNRSVIAEKSRMLAPIFSGDRFRGVVSLHCAEPRQWSPQDEAAVRDAQARIVSVLSRQDVTAPPELVDLREAATQGVLDRLRTAIDVQRCTFRQPVQEAFAFPVTFESRGEGMRSLLGDFTIVQTGQPVIVKLLETRSQVVQEDCRTASDDPLFYKMLAHYGGMRAQVVTPFIVGDALKGVLSVHEVRAARKWTAAEKALAVDAAALIGALFETSRG